MTKASVAAYQLENLHLWDFTLTDAEMVALGNQATPVPSNRAAETASMMCINQERGLMGRCTSLLEEGVQDWFQ